MLWLITTGLKLAAIGILLLISWQDWHTRSVNWIAFPSLAGCLLISRLLREPAALVGWQSASNLLFLGLLLGTLTLYVRLRFRAAGLHLRECLGSGDILFWLVLALYLPPAELLLFLIGSSVVALLLAGLHFIHLLPGQTRMTVPLAGIQASCLALLVASQWLPGRSGLFAYLP